MLCQLVLMTWKLVLRHLAELLETEPGLVLMTDSAAVHTLLGTQCICLETPGLGVLFWLFPVKQWGFISLLFKE